LLQKYPLSHQSLNSIILRLLIIVIKIRLVDFM